MNQILSTENYNNNGKKRRKSSGGTAKDIFSISKFFAITLVVFGIFLIASSSYALYNGNSGKASIAQKNELKPNVRVEAKGEDEVLITIIHDGVAIKEFKYYWDEENIITIDGQNRTFIQETIDIPNGESQLTVIAKDENGNETKITEKFEKKSAIQIDMQQSGNNVKISAISNEKEIKTISYSWDDEDKEKIDVNDKNYSFEIEILIGEHELNVTATDIDGNTEEKSITVKGYTKPTASIEAGNDCYVIKAHDDSGLSKVVIETVEDGKKTTMESDGKDFEFEFPLKEGSENYIKVTAYNKYGVQSKTKKAVWNK